MKIEIKTDDYPGHTSWELTDALTNNTLLEGGSNYSESTLYPRNECVNKTDCYQFKIHDSWGDGICCDAGVGHYSITYNNLFFAQEEEFKDEESVFFGDNCSDYVRPFGADGSELKASVGSYFASNFTTLIGT